MIFRGLAGLRIEVAQEVPHMAGVLGNIWFTGNFKGYIGKFDPSTSAFAEYPMPDPAARDPHRPLFDQNGMLWFTVGSTREPARSSSSSRRRRNPILMGWSSPRKAFLSSTAQVLALADRPEGDCAK
jgi:hypothetical protein